MSKRPLCEGCCYRRDSDAGGGKVRCHHPQVHGTALAKRLGQSMRGWPNQFEPKDVTTCHGRHHGSPGLGLDDIVVIASTPEGRHWAQLTEALQLSAHFITTAMARGAANRQHMKVKTEDDRN